MTEHVEIESFDELSGIYSTWIIKYCSEAFDSPLFLVWYTDTDEDNTDRLLTYKDGKIFASNSLENLKTTILSSIESLKEFENLTFWLKNFKNIEVKEYCTYDLIKISNEISKNNLDVSTIEGLVNFVSMYRDFVQQDERNSHLQVYSNNKLIQVIWDYFYDYIFWPRFNDKPKFEASDRPQLVISTKKLLVKIKDLIKTFDDNIKQTEKVIC